MITNNNLRSAIVTVVGHVDHGKTSLLDRFRGTSFQESESGGITQKISFTRYPLDRLKQCCPLLSKHNVSLEIPGLLFIDTPGHAAFTNLRKRGGALADLAILVVAAKEGIKPQTAEVLQILKAHKTPFLIAFNKIDNISGWSYDQNRSLKESIESQAIHVAQEFQESLAMFQGSLFEQGFDSALYYEVSDFTKKIALVPCSARTGEGIPELLFVLSGLCEKFLKSQLVLNKEAKGVILEVKKEKTMDCIEAILYDGSLDEGDEIAIAGFDETITTKVKAIEEIEPLSFKFGPKKQVTAASGVRFHLSEKRGILAGMPFQEINNDLETIKDTFKKQLSQELPLDDEGIIVKADSLGSLEALFFLLRQENIKIVRAGIGDINKSDVVAAKANLDINPLNAIILGFNVKPEEEFDFSNVKLLTNEVIYKLIEDLQEWRKNKQTEIEREKILTLSPVGKLEILHKYVFRNSNPAIFGVRVAAGRIKTGLPLIDEDGEEVARLKSMQHEKASVEEGHEGQELAIALPGINFERRLGDKQFLYTDLSSSAFRKLKSNKEMLSPNEIQAIQEILAIKRRKDIEWGA